MSNELSAKMSGWLAHVRAASEQELSLRAYATGRGLSVGALYQAKAQLMKVGAWPRSGRTPRVRAALRGRGSAAASGFVPVRIGDALSCRLSHGSGWRIECDGLPPVAWVHELLREAFHAAA